MQLIKPEIGSGVAESERVKQCKAALLRFATVLEKGSEISFPKILFLAKRNVQCKSSFYFLKFTRYLKIFKKKIMKMINELFSD